MSHYYEVYGFLLESDIKIDTLTSTKNLGVNVKIQQTSILEKNLISNDNWFYKGEDFFLFYIETVGYYKVSKKSIEIDLQKNYSQKDFEVYLLGTALGIVMFFNDIIAIHGGIINLKGKTGIVISGQMGAGKSSLIDCFIDNGHKFLSDDVARVFDDESNILLSPAYNQRRLCKDYIESGRYNIDTLELRDEEREKYAIEDINNYLDEKISLEAIIELRIGKEVKIESVIGIEKIKVITNNIYRIEILGQDVLNGLYFKKILDLAKRVKVFRVYRPSEGMHTELQKKIILQ